MQKLKMESVDMTERNIERIATLFPNVITEVKDENGKLRKTINFELLKQELSPDVIDGEECYDFTWVGKKASIVEANRPIRKTLRPCITESKDWETTGNLYIEGDNLDVLKLLQESYLNSIKMIYIDPPYNTGKDFIYKDNFTMDKDDYEEEIGLYDEDDNRLFQNTDSNGRFHSDWCSMMYPRLKLARNLLSEDGVIFISIDDNEVHNLRKICDEIFGESNFVAVIVWEKMHTRKNSARYFSVSHDYIICVSKNKELFNRNLIPRADTSAYKNPDGDPRGPWKADPIYANNPYNADYTIEKPNGTILSRPPGRFWRYSKTTIDKAIEENRIIWGNDDSYPMLKRYLSDVSDGLVPTTLFGRDFAGDNMEGNNEIKELFHMEKIFSYPKPSILLKRLLQIGSNTDSLVLDFFSGSATTAHAVMQLNAEDGGNRKFIMVQLPEPTDEKSEAYKAGYKNICEVGKERIRRAGDKINEEILNNVKQLKLGGEKKEPVDIGFRVVKVDSTNMKDVYYAADEYSQHSIEELESNIKDDRTDMDLLYGVLIDWGLPLSLSHKIETIEDARVHTVDEGSLIACFTEKISENVVREIAKRQPLRAVFRDSSFKDSADKINVVEIFKLLAPNTSVKVI